jgi:hypothetical protein
MPSNQRGKCLLLAALDEPLKEHGVGNSLPGSHQPTEVLYQL